MTKTLRLRTVAVRDNITDPAWLRAQLSARFSAATTEGGVPALSLDVKAYTKAVTTVPKNRTIGAFHLHRVAHEMAGSRRTSDLGIEPAVLLFGDQFQTRPGVLGFMFDSGFTGSERRDRAPRQGAAVFLGSIRGNRPSDTQFSREVLYTAMHELGHMFNLWHVGNATYMRRSPGGSNSHPDSHFKFSSDQRRLLRLVGTSRFFCPGGSVWGKRGGHAPDGGGFQTNTIDPSSALELHIDIRPREFYPVEPIEMDVRLRVSKDAGAVEVPDVIDPGYDAFRIWVENAYGERRIYRPLKRFCQSPGTLRVRAGMPFVRDISVFGDGRGYTFAECGAMRLWCEFDLDAGLRIRSNKVDVKVKPLISSRKAAKREAFLEFLAKPQVAERLFYRTDTDDMRWTRRIRDAAPQAYRKETRGMLEYACARMQSRDYGEESGRRMSTKRRDSVLRSIERCLDAFPKSTNRRRVARELLKQVE